MLLATGSFNPPTFMHLRMFGESSYKNNSSRVLCLSMDFKFEHLLGIMKQYMTGGFTGTLFISLKYVRLCLVLNSETILHYLTCVILLALFVNIHVGACLVE